MSEEKVLTLRGTKAVWAPAPSGGDVQVVTLTQENDAFVSSHTASEIAEMAKKGAVICDVAGTVTANLAGVVNGNATFIAVMSYSGTSMMFLYVVTANGTASQVQIEL